MEFYFFKIWSKYYLFYNSWNYWIVTWDCDFTYLSFKINYVCNCENGFCRKSFIYYSFKNNNYDCTYCTSLVWVKLSVTSKSLEARIICFTILKNRIVYEKHILRVLVLKINYISILEIYWLRNLNTYVVWK